MVPQFDHFLKGIVDEDEADETGKALLSETGKILNQETGIGRHKKKTEERWPQTDPQSKLQVVEVVITEKKK